jgi:deoxyxylulose-5-phosphate synthase
MLQEADYFPKHFVRLGLPDAFAPHGSQNILRKLYGIDAEGIENAAYSALKRRHVQALSAIG